MASAKDGRAIGKIETVESESTKHPARCMCKICANEREFEISDDLIESLSSGKMAIFAGAGVSTETANVVGHSLYDEIRHDLGLKAEQPEFPELITRYCARPNGRLRFIEKVTERFSYVKSTPEIYWSATRFHRELAPISHVDTIVTTNWDDFFERECWATPFVFSEDTAFWTAADRKILKIHGTIENLGSIVASNEDYEKCKLRLSQDLIGSRLKIILSEKTVVFCGYSLKDFDFQEIMKFVHSEMNGFHRQAYVVTIDNSVESKARFAEYGLIPIFTDASFFLRKMHERLSENPCVASVSMYDDAEYFLGILIEEHSDLSDSFNMHDYPQVIYSLFYQDGLIHALKRIVHLRKSGAYTDHHLTRRKVENYALLRQKAIRLRRYDDAAYIQGYINGLMYSLSHKDDPEEFPPLYFLFKDKYAWNIQDFETMLKSEDVHRPSAKRAEKIVSAYPRTSGMVLDHEHRLFGLH